MYQTGPKLPTIRKSIGIHKRKRFTNTQRLAIIDKAIIISKPQVNSSNVATSSTAQAFIISAMSDLVHFSPYIQFGSTIAV